MLAAIWVVTLAMILSSCSFTELFILLVGIGTLPIVKLSWEVVKEILFLLVTEICVRRATTFSLIKEVGAL